MSQHIRKNSLSPERIQKLEEVRDKITTYAENIQKVIDYQITGSALARSLDLTPGNIINGSIDQALRRRYHLYYCLTADDIHKLLEETMSPADNLVRAILGYRGNQFVYLPDDIESKVQDAMKILNAREYSVLCYRFGFDGDPLTLRETGKKMSISPERVRQIEARALRKLRHPIRFQKLIPGYDLRLQQYEDLEAISQKIQHAQQKLGQSTSTSVTTLYAYQKIDSRVCQSLRHAGITDMLSLAPYSQLALQNTMHKLGTKSMAIIVDALAMFGVTIPEKIEPWIPEGFDWSHLDTGRIQVHCTDLESWYHLINTLYERKQPVESKFYLLSTDMTPFFNQYRLTIYLRDHQFNVDKDEYLPVIHWNYSEREKDDESR